MKISIMQWIRAVLVGLLAGFAILGAKAAFMQQLPLTRGQVWVPIGFCVVVALLATLAAARWVWPHTKPTVMVLRERQPDRGL